jgi:hypothetical protein
MRARRPCDFADGWRGGGGKTGWRGSFILFVHRRFLGLGFGVFGAGGSRFGFGLRGRRGCGAVLNAQDDLADREFIALLDAELAHLTRHGGRNGRHSFLILELENGLALLNLVAFLNEDTHDGAGLGPFA